MKLDRKFEGDSYVNGAADLRQKNNHAATPHIPPLHHPILCSDSGE